MILTWVDPMADAPYMPGLAYEHSLAARFTFHPCRVAILAPGAKLDHLEHDVVLSHSVRYEKNGPLRCHGDQDAYDQEYRKGHD